jgi:hypothetical protein
MAFFQNQSNLFLIIYLSNKIHQFAPFYNQKKGRKNSAPKPTGTVSFSPDGAVIT